MDQDLSIDMMCIMLNSYMLWWMNRLKWRTLDFHFDQNDRRLYSYEPIVILSFFSQLIQRSIFNTVWGQNYLTNDILTVSKSPRKSHRTTSSFASFLVSPKSPRKYHRRTRLVWQSLKLGRIMETAINLVCLSFRSRFHLMIGFQLLMIGTPVLRELNQDLIDISYQHPLHYHVITSSYVWNNRWINHQSIDHKEPVR